MRNQNKTPGYTRYESARTTRKTKLATLRQPNVREIKEKLVCITTGGANSKNICFGRTAKFIGELKILPGIGSFEKLFGKLQMILEYYIIYLEVASNFVLNQETSPFA